jgi:hypothetical protein
LISVTRRGEPDARTSLGRPIMEQGLSLRLPAVTP